MLNLLAVAVQPIMAPQWTVKMTLLELSSWMTSTSEEIANAASTWDPDPKSSTCNHY